MKNAKLHIPHRVVFLCEISRDWSGFVLLEFLNTVVVFIHPIPNRLLVSRTYFRPHLLQFIM